MPVYSHSRLSAFENCPLQYRFRYIDRVRTDFESIDAFAGKRVHEVLQEVYSDLGRARAEGLAAARARYNRLWDDCLTSNVRVVRPDLDQGWYRRLGERCVENYWNRNYPFRIDPSQIIGIELKVELSLDPGGRYRMVGYVDRAQHAGPGLIEIHDYKTTLTLPRPGSLRFDRQLPLYEIALRQQFPQTREVRLIWHFLAHETEVVETRRPEDLERVKRSAVSLIQNVERAYEFPSKKGPLCAWCEYQEVCPEWRSEKPVAPPAFPYGVPFGTEALRPARSAPSASRPVEPEAVRVGAAAPPVTAASEAAAVPAAGEAMPAELPRHDGASATPPNAEPAPAIATTTQEAPVPVALPPVPPSPARTTRSAPLQLRLF